MFTLFLSLYSTISSVSPEVKSNAQKRSTFNLIAHKVLDSQWKKRYFWMVPEPLVQQFKKKNVGALGTRMRSFVHRLVSAPAPRWGRCLQIFDATSKADYARSHVQFANIREFRQMMATRTSSNQVCYKFWYISSPCSAKRQREMTKLKVL